MIKFDLKTIFLFFLFSIIIILTILNFFYEFISIEAISNFVNSFGMFSIVIFAFLYISISLLGVSTVILTILAGTLFWS